MFERLLQWLITSAAARWPTRDRDEIHREWAAEVHALRHEPGVAAPVRTWRRFAFATSLALARPDGMVGGRAGVEPLLLHAAALFLAPLAVIAMVQAGLQTLTVTLRLSDLSFEAYAVARYLALLAVAVMIGALLAGRVRRRNRGRSSLGYLLPAAVMPVAGLLPAGAFARASDILSTEADAGSGRTLLGMACLAVLLAPAVTVVVVLARRHAAVAMAVAGLSAPVVVATAMLLVEGWLGTAPAAVPVSSWTPPRLLPGTVLSTVLLTLTYVVWLARRPRPGQAAVAGPAAGQRPDGIPAIARSVWWHRCLLTGAGFAAFAWALTLTYLTPNIGVQESWPREGEALAAGWAKWNREEGRVWMQDLQLFTIVCAALCLLCAAAYRGTPLLPVLGGTAVLVAADIAVVRAGWTNLPLLPLLTAAALLLGTAAWWASLRLGRHGRAGPARGRRLVIGVAVLAAFLVPGTYIHWYVPPIGVQTPPVVLLVVVGVPAVLAILVGLGVTAAARRPPARPAWQVPADLALATAAVGVLLFTEPTRTLISPLASWHPEWFWLVLGPPTLSVPLAAWTIATIRRRAPLSRQRLALWVILALPLLAVGYPLARAAVFLGFDSRHLLPYMEYGQAYDGLPYVAGGLAIGLLIAALAATRLERSEPGPTPPSHPPTVKDGTLVPADLDVPGYPVV